MRHFTTKGVALAFALVAIAACGGGGGGGVGGGGGGGGSTIVTNTADVPAATLVKAPTPSAWRDWTSLSWAGATASTALTQHVGGFMYSLGVPTSTYGFALSWYSRTNVAGWDGNGHPPMMPDDVFTVASAMTDRFFDDPNNSAANTPYQGFYYSGWPAAFNEKAFALMTAKKPFVVQLGVPFNGVVYQRFVMVTGLTWLTDRDTGNLIRVTSVRIYDPNGIVPTNITAAVQSQYGIYFNGVAWMEQSTTSRPVKKGEHLAPINAGEAKPTTWPESNWIEPAAKALP